MEGLPNYESREDEIDALIEQLAEAEGMNKDDIISDIITFAPIEGSENSNPDYIAEVAEMIGISIEEMNKYALQKAEEYLGED